MRPNVMRLAMGEGVPRRRAKVSLGIPHLVSLGIGRSSPRPRGEGLKARGHCNANLAELRKDVMECPLLRTGKWFGRYTAKGLRARDGAYSSD